MTTDTLLARFKSAAHDGTARVMDSYGLQRGYSRVLDLPPFPELLLIELTDPKLPDDLDALSREQLKTSLIIFALHFARRKTTVADPMHRIIGDFIARESEIRCEQLTHEAMLRREGKL